MENDQMVYMIELYPWDFQAPEKDAIYVVLDKNQYETAVSLIKNYPCRYTRRRHNTILSKMAFNKFYELLRYENGKAVEVPFSDYWVKSTVPQGTAQMIILASMGS